MSGSRFRPLREVAREVGVPERVLAAYAGRYAAFIPCLEEGRRRLYGPAAAAALALVARLRATGADEAEIAAELGRGPVSFAPPAPTLVVGAVDLASALNRRRDRRRRGLAALADAVRALAEATDRYRASVRALREGPR